MQSTYLGKIYKLMLKICLKYKKNLLHPLHKIKRNKSENFCTRLNIYYTYVLIIYCVFHVNYSFERELGFFLKEISNPSNFLWRTYLRRCRWNSRFFFRQFRGRCWSFRSLKTKPSLKIGSVNKAFLFWYWQGLKKKFF